MAGAVTHTISTSVIVFELTGKSNSRLSTRVLFFCLDCKTEKYGLLLSHSTGTSSDQLHWKLKNFADM